MSIQNINDLLSKPVEFLSSIRVSSYSSKVEKKESHTQYTHDSASNSSNKNGSMPKTINTHRTTEREKGTHAHRIFAVEHRAHQTHVPNQKHCGNRFFVASSTFVVSVANSTLLSTDARTFNTAREQCEPVCLNMFQLRAF